MPHMRHRDVVIISCHGWSMDMGRACPHAARLAGHFRRTAVVCRSLKGYQLEMLQVPPPLPRRPPRGGPPETLSS